VPRMRLLRGLALRAAVPIAVASLAACAGTLADGGDQGAGEASCAALIVYQGTDYWGFGELKRDPATTGRQVRGVLPGCDDTGGQAPAEPQESVQVAELVDVALETAFLWNGSIFIRDGRELPPSARTWFRAPRCTTPGEFKIVADWLGVTGPKKPRFDGDLRLPYRLEAHVTDGPSGYVGATIAVRADAATEPALRPEDVKRSLWRGGQVAGRVVCDAGRFRALELRVPRRH
jgi:hypothetical protein